MLSIFVEASCNRYNRDECIDCHVYEPLKDIPKAEWHLTPEDAQVMAEKIKQMDVLQQLANQEINLTGGEASMNPNIVEIFKIFRTVTPNVCLHTNLDINSENSKRWQRLTEIMQLGGRLDITFYPVAWEKMQKPLLSKILQMQKHLLVNIVFENLQSLSDQIGLLLQFFQEKGARYSEVINLLSDYQGKVLSLLKKDSPCREADYIATMGDTGAFARSDDFTFGINLLPGFKVNAQGQRSMTTLPFPNDLYLIECPAARGSIDIMTIQQTGEMTPCCDVGNLKCQAKFGNLLTDSPEQLLEKFEESGKRMSQGIQKNRENIKNSNAGQWVDEGIPPYCN